MSTRGPSRRCACQEAVAPSSVTTNKNGGVQRAHYRCAKCGATFDAASGDHLASAIIVAVGCAGFAGGAFFLPKLPFELALGVSVALGGTALFHLVRAVRCVRVWRAHPIVG